MLPQNMIPNDKEARVFSEQHKNSIVVCDVTGLFVAYSAIKPADIHKTIECEYYPDYCAQIYSADSRTKVNHNDILAPGLYYYIAWDLPHHKPKVVSFCIIMLFILFVISIGLTYHILWNASLQNIFPVFWLFVIHLFLVTFAIIPVLETFH